MPQTLLYQTKFLTVSEQSNALSGTDFDRKKDYFLVLKDKDLNIEMQRYKVTIDLAFTDDFFW